MSVPQIIWEINEMIRDTHASREKKKSKIYKNLAMRCWQEVVPEHTEIRIPFKLSNPVKYRSVGQRYVMRSRNMRQNPKFCMFLTGRLPAAIFIG